MGWQMAVVGALGAAQYKQQGAAGKYNQAVANRNAEIAEQEAADPMAGASSVRKLIPALLRTYLPSYTPHKVEISPGIQTLADKYTAMAIKTS